MSRRLIRASNLVLEIDRGRITRMTSPDGVSEHSLPIDDYPQGVILAPRRDHHLHPFGYAAATRGLSLAAATSLREVAELVAEAASRLPAEAALVGHQLDDERLDETRLPTRPELDAVAGERPVLLHRYCGHVAVANTRALTLAGVASRSGILRESEIQPVANALLPHQPALSEAEVGAALTELAGLGLGRVTAIISAAEPLWCSVPDEIGMLLAVAPQVPLDFEVLVIAATPQDLELAANRLRSGPSNVDFLGWKEFADGALGGRTAALYQPFHDDPSNWGILRLDPTHAADVARVCLGLGGTVAIHAIGDLANDRVLDLYEQLIENGADPFRLRIEHASMLHPASVERMAQLGVTASVQPAFITSEVGWLEKRIGERTAITYQLGTLLRAGIRVLGGSDAPVESPTPWEGIASAITGAGLSPQQAFSLFGGELEPGTPAHLLVVDRDPRLHSQPGATRVLASYRHGELADLGG